MRGPFQTLIVRLGLPLALLAACGQTRSNQTQETELAKLQTDFAMHYLEPEPHLALAQYYLNHDNKREAFYTLETARRSRFEAAVFDHAFQVMFEGFDNGKAAENKLLDELKGNPESVEAMFRLADIYISRSDWTPARDYLLAAQKRKPDDFRFTAGLAGILDAQGKAEEAKRLVQKYAQDYPQSRDAYALKADQVGKTNPALRKQIINQGIAKFPDDGGLWFQMGVLLQEAGDLDKAEAAFVKAASLGPKSKYIQTWVGRFFFKVRKDNDRALPYYLNAYFLSPHAYETEFVESRIRNIYGEQAARKFADHTKAKTPLTEILRDSDPNVVLMALESIRGKWQPDYLDPIVALMGHENAGVRWEATDLLKPNVGDAFDERLKALLRDTDPRKRGLAAYIAVYRWKESSFALIDELLRDNAELVRFDAVSALILEGGEAGKNHALAHGSKETNPQLKKIIESARAKPSTTP